MVQSAIVESIGTEGDLTAGLEGEEEVESSGGELETPSEIGGAKQLLSYTIQFPMQSSYTKRKTRIVLGAAVLTI